MERYSYLQAMPNSPLTPLTPLCENTQFEFNFGGDGSLDEYIASVRQEHRVEQQRKKLLQHANQTFQKKFRAPLPRRYSEEFLKIRDVFECPNHECDQHHYKQHTTKQESPNATPKASTLQIIYTEATPTVTKNKQVLNFDYAKTPTNVRTPLKLKNNNVALNINANIFNSRRHQKFQQKQIMQPQKKQPPQINRVKKFLKTSPVPTKPLCPQVANILHQCGLSMYCGIFHREEIDLLAFRLLHSQDLYDLGITNPNHCAILMKNIQFVQ